MKSCRTCRHLDVRLDAAGRRTPRKNNVYACAYPLPALPPLPESITSAYGWRVPTDTDKRWMVPDDGGACRTYERLVKATA